MSEHQNDVLLLSANSFPASIMRHLVSALSRYAQDEVLGEVFVRNGPRGEIEFVAKPRGGAHEGGR